MSHYTRINLLQMNNQAALLAALADVGFSRDKVEVHELEPVAVVGYQGDVREQRAHLIIRRRHIGGLSNDVGFVRGDDGIYQALISQYDSRRFDQAWLDNLAQRYAYHATIQQLALEGYTLSEETREDGTIHLMMVAGRA